MERLQLPSYLQSCVDSGLIDFDKAEAIERFRRSSGVGLTRSIERFGGVLEDHGTSDASLSRDARQEYVPLLLLAPPDPELSFESFIPCRANEFPLEVARIIAAEGGTRSIYNPLYVYGDVGIGKTHLQSAIALASGDLRSILINTADLAVEYERVKRLNARAEFRSWLISWDILLVDDIQLCEGSESLQRELFAVFNHLTQAKKAVVISSDVPPTRLRGIESRLLSRLGSGVIVGLQMGDRQERVQILRMVLGDRKLPSEVVDYLADRVTDSVRRLKGAAKQLLVMQGNTDREITLDLARAVVPLPEDLSFSIRSSHEPAVAGSDGPVRSMNQVERFKEMISTAESEAEQTLALQIVVGQRLRQLRAQGGDPQTLIQLERALEALRDGRLKEALALMGEQLGAG